MQRARERQQFTVDGGITAATDTSSYLHSLYSKSSRAKIFEKILSKKFCVKLVLKNFCRNRFQRQK